MMVRRLLFGIVFVALLLEIQPSAASNPPVVRDVAITVPTSSPSPLAMVNAIPTPSPTTTLTATASPTPTPPPPPPSAKPKPKPTTGSTPPSSNDPLARLANAASYAADHHVRVGIAVLDLKTGAYYASGRSTDLFASASVMKVLIATKLLATDQMHGADETMATSMIERSDDDAVDVLWPKVGGSAVLPWVASHYGISDLGTPNTRPGYWGNTHFRAKGLAYLYRALRNDPVVWPWLSNAMQHATRIAADGTDQYFGIPSATKDWAIKQGWGAHSADDWDNAVINSTGYVDGERYVVVILSEGVGYNGSSNADGYNAALAAVVTHLAQTILPGGRF